MQGSVEARGASKAQPEEISRGASRATWKPAKPVEEQPMRVGGSPLVWQTGDSQRKLEAAAADSAS
jgi:hypothetical protein